MSNPKRFTQSQDQIDRGLIESLCGGQPDVIDEDGSKKLLQDLSELQLVRVPGEGPLELNEAIAVAIDQGDAFERWCEIGARVREIEVWVEKLRGILVLPDGPAELRKIEFSVPSPDSAVLQVTTEADGKRIVLYNLLLRDVPAGVGLRHIESWPNGQSITIDVQREVFTVAAATAGPITVSHSQETTKFVITISVSSSATEGALQTGVDTTDIRRSPVIHEKDRFAMQKPRAKTARAGASFTSAVLPIVFLCVGLAIAAVKARTTTNSNSGEQRAALQSGDAVLQDTDQRTHTNEESTSFDLANPSANAISENNGAIKSQQIFSAKNRNGDTGSDRTVQRVSHHSGENIPVVQDQNSKSLWQTMVLPKLAVMKTMYVQMDPEVSEPSGLKNLFIRALQASDQFHVVDDKERSKADGVITLSVEESSPCVDVVFAKVTGPDGKFLWRDHAFEARKTCVSTPTNRQDTMFSQASSTLVGSFENTVREAQRTTESKESMTDGG